MMYSVATCTDEYVRTCVRGKRAKRQVRLSHKSLLLDGESIVGVVDYDRVFF